MLRVLDRFDARSVEESSRKFWVSRSLPPPTGILGPTAAPRLHQLFGTLTREETGLALVQRAVLADVDARYLGQAGRRTSGRILLRQRGADGELAAAGELLRRLGVWIGGGQLEPVSGESAADRTQAMVDRLAASNILVSREAPLRSCPRCRLPRTPVGIIYEEEHASTFLVRFPLRDTSPRASLLVWVDSLWKLLGTTALLVHPEQTYVSARYRRHDSEETVIISRAGLERLRSWLPGSDLEPLSDMPGASLEGRRYDHPLANEAPGLGSIEGAAGAIHASPEVTDSGTGVVTLVPSHGAGDAAVGRTLGVAGWPILDPDLTLSSSFAHKYQGLAIDAAESFIQRDLNDGGYLFAELTVRRGVPHCAVCGEPLVWETGRAWCLEPGRLPAERLELLGRLLPHEPIPAGVEAVPWPVSEQTTTDDRLSPVLLDCSACGRLAPAAAGPVCSCGGARTASRRRLLPVFQESMVAWARESPFPSGEGLRLYVANRRKVPSVIHHLVAMEAADAHPGDVRLSVFPTLPVGPTQVEVGPDEPLDAIRATLVALGETPRAGALALADRRVAERRRLEKAWVVVRDAVDAMHRDGYAIGSTPIGARLGDLQAEDRAFLSRFERLRIAVLREYDLGRLALVQNRLVRFFDDELRDGFLPLIRRRLDSPGLPPEKAAAYAVLGHVLPLWAELYAPIAPFTCEAIYRSFRGESESVFERPHTPILEPVLDPNAERAYDRWRSVTRALTRARRHLGVPARTLLERVVLFVRDEQAAVELRAAAETLGRIANVRLVEVASPNQPWEGKRVDAIPVLPAIQKVFGTGTPRVVRLLSGLPGRRVQEGIRSRSLEVAVEGRPVQIIRSMVEFVESLPEGVVPIPWELGELFIQVPAGARTGEEGQAPPLTPDGFRFLRRVRHRLRRASDPASLSGIVVCAQGRLAEEVERQQTALTRYLRVPRLRVVAAADGFPPAETLVGRSGRGERWFVWVPGVSSPPPRRKEHRAHPEVGTGRRAPESEATVVDYLSPAVLEREHDLQEWVKRLDVALGRPIVGPSKLRYAWELGIRSYDDLTRAPYDQLAQLPGFGPYVAGEIVRSFGGVVPEHNRPVQSLVQYRSTVARPANPVPTGGGPSDVVAEGPASATDPSLGPSTPEKPLETGPSPPPPPTAATESPVFVGGSGDSGRGAPSEVGEAGPAPGSPAESPALENPPDGSAFSPVEPAEKLDPATGVASAVAAELPTPEPSPLPYPEPPAPPDEAATGNSGAVASPSRSDSDGRVEPSGNDSVPESEPVTEVIPPSAPAASDGVSTPDPASSSSLTEAPLSPPEPEPAAQTPDHRGDSKEPETAPPPPVGEETPAPSPAVVDPEPALPQDPTQPEPAESVVVAVGESPPEPAPPAPAPMSSMEPANPVFDTPSREPPAELQTSEESPVAPAPGSGAEEAVTTSSSVEPQTLPSVEASPLASEVPPATAPTVEVRVNELSPPPPEFSAPPPVAEPRRVGTFVVAEPVNGPTWATFLDATAAGHRGLCLSREFPDRLRAMIGPRDVTVVWLSNAGRAGAARPGDLPALRALIEGMVTKDGVSAIYIDSVEFLIRVNSIERVLDFLRGLHELATERKVRLWVPVNPLLASAADVEQLTTAF